MNFGQFLKRVFEREPDEYPVPEGMILVSRETLEGYLSECDNPVPDAVLRLHYRGRLRDCLNK